MRLPISMIGRIAGALLSGRIAELIGYRYCMQSALLVSVVACVGLSFSGSILLLALVCFLLGLGYGFYSVAFCAAAMRLCDPRVAASMFAIFMVFINVGIAGGQALGGVVTDALGFQSLCGLMALLCLSALALTGAQRKRPDA